MRDAKNPLPLPRYDRERWLETALSVLATEGGARLRIESLVRSLGVTKGSFYHHFKNREDFVRALIDYWSKEFTESVIAIVNAHEVTPSERLLELTHHIEKEGLDRFEPGSQDLLPLPGWRNGASFFPQRSPTHS